jgi:alpha-galactosidase
MAGTFGYELDITKISEADKNAIPAQIEEYKKYSHLVRDGDHYRIGDLFRDDIWDAWMFVAKDKSEALFTFVQVLARPNFRSRRVKLKGLDPNALYKNEQTGETHSGSALMNAGVNVLPQGDFSSVLLHFTVV